MRVDVIKLLHQTAECGDGPGEVSFDWLECCRCRLSHPRSQHRRDPEAR